MVLEPVRRRGLGARACGQGPRPPGSAIRVVRKTEAKDPVDRQEATKLVPDCLRTMLARKGSDHFISAEFPPARKIDGRMALLSDRALTGVQTSVLVRSIMNYRVPGGSVVVTPDGARRQVSGGLAGVMVQGSAAASVPGRW